MLYIVSTPIGNLEDITLRAVTVLSEAHLILAEDTRHTRILLDRIGVSTPMLSSHEHNEAARVEAVLDRLSQGQNVAMVSDAGTPLLSDPGARLVAAAVAAGFAVVPIPGPSALLAALVGSGLDATRFRFMGFLPRSGEERTALLAAIRSASETCVVYEAPTRIVELVGWIASTQPERKVVVARELTKMHEEFVRGTASQVAIQLGDSVRGECVVVIDGAAPQAPSQDAIADRLKVLRAEGHTSRDVARALRSEFGLDRNEAYRLALDSDPGA